jgi:hypothetical protein
MILSWVVWGIGFLAFIGGVKPAHPATDVLAVTAAAPWLAFTYAMYLGIVVMRMGDPWLVRRGIKGTARVTSAKETNMAIAAGEYYGIGAPRIWIYGLEVSLPNRDPYKTKLWICAYLDGLGTVPVCASRFNRKRVTVNGPELTAAA